MRFLGNVWISINIYASPVLCRLMYFNRSTALLQHLSIYSSICISMYWSSCPHIYISIYSSIGLIKFNSSIHPVIFVATGSSLYYLLYPGNCSVFVVDGTDDCYSHLWKSSSYVIIFKAVNCVICIDWLRANVYRVTDYDWHVDGRVVLWVFRSWHGGHDDVKTLEGFQLHLLFVSGTNRLPMDKGSII